MNTSVFANKESIFRFELLCRYFRESRKRWDFVPLTNMGAPHIYQFPSKGNLRTILSSLPNDFRIYETKTRKGIIYRVKIINESNASKTAEFLIRPRKFQPVPAEFIDLNELQLGVKKELFELDDSLDTPVMRFALHYIADGMREHFRSTSGMEDSKNKYVEEEYLNARISLVDQDILNVEGDPEATEMTVRESLFGPLWFIIHAHIISLYPRARDIGRDQYLDLAFLPAYEDFNAVGKILDDIGELKVSEVMELDRYF